MADAAERMQERKAKMQQKKAEEKVIKWMRIEPKSNNCICTQDQGCEQASLKLLTLHNVSLILKTCMVRSYWPERAGS